MVGEHCSPWIAFALPHGLQATNGRPLQKWLPFYCTVVATSGKAAGSSSAVSGRMERWRRVQLFAGDRSISDGFCLVHAGGAGVVVHRRDIGVAVGARILLIMPLPTIWLGRQPKGWAQTILPRKPPSTSSIISAVNSQPSHIFAPSEMIPSGFLHQLAERPRRVEAVLAHGVVAGAADAVQPAQELVGTAGHQLVAAVQVDVQPMIGHAVLHKAPSGRAG